LRSPRSWLFAKEWRELVSSRAYWVLLVVIGPLAGMSFISAVTAYGELSAANGTGEGVGQAFSPLTGIWAPTFSACELASAFLLPFVAIRLVSGDRQSGASKIEMQHPLSSWSRLLVKGAVLMIGWLIATAAPATGVLLWASYGGHVDAPELLSVIAGHVLNGGLTIALAVTAAALTEHPATAAIVTLTVTVGTWLINFAAAVNGGWWERAAQFTPTAMVAEFQRGLLRADITLAALTLIVAGLALAAVWLRIGASPLVRVRASVLVVAIAALAVAGAARVRASWDVSESRSNSFSLADEAAMRTIRGALKVRAHFAPEDPRRSDLEYRGLRKLRRAVPHADIEYVSATSTGLFEQSNDQYGEVWYELDGRKVVSRITTAEGVRDAVFDVANLQIPPGSQPAEEMFRGYPLATEPRGAAPVFFGVWPVVIVVIAFAVQWRNS